MQAPKQKWNIILNSNFYTLIKLLILQYTLIKLLLLFQLIIVTCMFEMNNFCILVCTLCHYQVK